MKALLAIWLSAFSTLAVDVKLAWDANSEENVSGYKLHWGSSSGNYSSTNSIIGRTNTTAIASNLPLGIVYFAATAIGEDGQESDRSSEISFTNGITSRLIVILDKNGTFVQVQAITDLLMLKGWEVCSRVDGIWFLSGVPDTITSRVIAEDIAKNPLVATKVKLVIKIPDDGPITYWGNAPKEVWIWMAKFWGKAR